MYRVGSHSKRRRYFQCDDTKKDLSGVEIVVRVLKEIMGHLVIEGLGQITPPLNFLVAESTGNSSSSAAAIGQPDGT
jgi:hypothetical protein